MRSRPSSLPDFDPIAPHALPDLLASWLADSPTTIRVAIDGPPCAHPHRLAAELAEPLRVRSRQPALVRADTFWRDASIRLEYGHRDVDSYLTWLDAGALRREVLQAGASYLPSLRDPVTNRATREPPRPLPPGSVLVVSGTFLLGLGLPFDRTVHLAMSPAARARRTPADQAWTLPGFQRYDAEVAPAERADVVIRLDDPRHPAVRGPARPG